MNNKIKNKENYYILPRFNKHSEDNCAVCRYVRGIEELLGASEFDKYSKLLGTIEGDYKLANLEDLEELDMKVYYLEKENAALKIANSKFTDDYKLQQKAINTLNGSGLKLMDENKKLKVKISILEKAGEGK